MWHTKKFPVTFQLNELLGAGTTVGQQTLTAAGFGELAPKLTETQAAINAIQTQLDAIIAVMPTANCP